MAYTIATFSELTLNADGRPVVEYTYTGDAGERPVMQAIPVDVNVLPTSDSMRAIAIQRLQALNNSKTFMTAQSGRVGTVIDTTTPIPPPPTVVVSSYSAASAPFTPGANPQDVLTIIGSATKKVEIVRTSIMTVQNTAGMNAWALLKRSTANAGGTFTAVNIVPTEKTFPPATAVVRQYTANPATPGTLVGNIWSGRVASPLPASAPAGDTQRELVSQEGRPVATLIDTSDILAWNFGGVGLPAGLSVQVVVWWNEIG